jgi:hypothetical protein
MLHVDTPRSGGKSVARGEASIASETPGQSEKKSSRVAATECEEGLPPLTRHGSCSIPTRGLRCCAAPLATLLRPLRGASSWLGTCPGIRICRVASAAWADARRRDAGNAVTLSRSDNDKPSFFSGNIAGLSQVLSPVSEIRVTEEEKPTGTTQTVLYYLGK